MQSTQDGYYNQPQSQQNLYNKKNYEEEYEYQKSSYNNRQMENDEPPVKGMSTNALSQQNAYPDEYEEQDDSERIECQTCGRKFNSQALVKHQKGCKKVFVEKRKVFDTKQQRALVNEEDGFGDGGYGYSKPAAKKK